MAKWKFLSWKTFSIILTIILVPFIVNLIANYTSWLSTKEKVKITLKLDGWITIGTLLQETDMPNLKLVYNDKPVKNALKISWTIINTGSTGISEFEKPPSIVYPAAFDIAEAKISETSPLLKIDKNLQINHEDKTIEVNNIGIFNPGDFFKIDVYILDIPESIKSSNYITEWDLKAKSVDLQLEKDITFKVPIEKNMSSKLTFMTFFAFINVILVLIAMLVVTTSLTKQVRIITKKNSKLT